jgi:ATP-dependent Lon protease
LLFGQGHIKESSRQQRVPLENMYGYGLEGYGYRYPKRKRRLTVETYYPEKLYPDVIRAATFNRAIAMENPWLKHLRKSGFYDEVRKLLQKARETYQPKDPAKRARVLSRELTKLQAQLNLLEKEKTAKTLEKEYKQKYGEKFEDLTYEKVLDDKIKRLQNEIARIQQSLPTGQLQQTLP